MLLLLKVDQVISEDQMKSKFLLIWIYMTTNIALISCNSDVAGVFKQLRSSHTEAGTRQHLNLD